MVAPPSPAHPDDRWSDEGRHIAKEESMGHPVTHFEIHGRDRQRLYDFYQQVFGWSIDANNPTGYGLVSTNAVGGGHPGRDHGWCRHPGRDGLFADR